MRIRCAAAVLWLLCPLSAEEITFSANGMTGTAGNTSDHTTLVGNAFVRTASIEIAADRIEMSGTDFRTVTATGNVTGKNFETNMAFSCGQMSYDRETKIAVLRDNVHLEDRENNVTADAEIIDYNQETDIAVLQINVSLTQKDTVCTGAYVVYQKKQQTLNVSGNAQVRQGTDVFRAQEITLNLQTQAITLDGRVRGSVRDDRVSAAGQQQNGETSSPAEGAADALP
ncbi:MAG: organic solvent tolerance protein OstA [Treponema sp.]|nr:organic solvent tolerance protein OstA [Treponema sp.]